MKKPKKQPSRRSKVKYPGLNPRYNSKIRQEYIDYDYIDKLSDKEKDLLNRFTEEHYGANFKHEGKKLFTSKKQRKICTDGNNARNRCSFGNTRAKTGLLYYDSENMSDLIESQQYTENGRNVEDAIIDYIDAKRELDVVANSVNNPDDGYDDGDDT